MTLGVEVVQEAFGAGGEGLPVAVSPMVRVSLPEIVVSESPPVTVCQ